MKENLHSLITMLENAFSEVKGCIALIGEDGLSLYSSQGCGDMITFEANASVMARNLFSTREQLKKIAGGAGSVNKGTFKTEETAYHICEVDDDIYFVVIATIEIYDKMRYSLDKFMKTWKAIKMLQDANIGENEIVEHFHLQE